MNLTSCRRRANPFFGALILFFTVPYFLALVVSDFRLSLPPDFFDLLWRSLLQAALSTFTAIVFGFVGATVLLRKSRRWEVLALAPAACPAIAIVVGFMTLFPAWRGWTAVAVAHALVCSGLVAVVLTRVIQGSLGGSLELAWTEGASRWMLWARGVVPALRRDIGRLAVAVFAASLASFSIPYLLGGTKAVSFEIAILHAIRLDAAWDTAAALSLFQWAILLATILVLSSDKSGSAFEASRSGESLGRTSIGDILSPGSRTLIGRSLVGIGVLALLFAPVLVGITLLLSPFEGFRQLQSAGVFDSREFLNLALRGSFVTATLSGIFSACLLTTFAFANLHRHQRTWISGYAAPSVAITGFATLALGWGRDPSFALDAFRIAVGCAMLFSPILWRLRWEQRLAHLDGQVAVAQTLGASHGMIIRRILMPELRDVFFWSVGIVSFWVWGDYAIGSIAASRAMTVGLVAKGLMESYRLEAASVLILLCLLLGGLSYRLFSMAGVRESDSREVR